MNGQNGNPNDGGNPIVRSSPNEVNLQGHAAVVVGDRAGHALAYNLQTGSPIPGWPVYDGGIPIDSSPSVSPVGGTVYIGIGNSTQPTSGGYWALQPVRRTGLVCRPDQSSVRSDTNRRSSRVDVGRRITGADGGHRRIFSARFNSH